MMRAETVPARRSKRRRTGRPLMIALVTLTSAFSFAAPPSPASAAGPNVSQCNAHAPGPQGATTALTCTVTITNTISHGKTHSTTTLTRNCKLGPCAPGNGTFTTSSTSLVTSVQQCNGSDNDAAHTVRCDVRIINNISADTPSAQPLTTATLNQCVGSGTGGGANTSACHLTLVGTTTTTAAVTQCNGSGNGGGGTVACRVVSASTLSRAIPIRVNQCNGTGNPGGSTVACSTRITTTVLAAVRHPAPPAAAPVSPRPAHRPKTVPRVASAPLSSGRIAKAPLSSGGVARAPLSSSSVASAPLSFVGVASSPLLAGGLFGAPLLSGGVALPPLLFDYAAAANADAWDSYHVALLAYQRMPGCRKCQTENQVRDDAAFDRSLGRDYAADNARQNGGITQAQHDQQVASSDATYGREQRAAFDIEQQCDAAYAKAHPEPLPPQ